MIDISEVVKIHHVLISKFGGSSGIRELSALESALQRPFQTFDSRELYPSVVEKAAALTESLLRNHPFVDGNKRVGYVLLRLYLSSHGFLLNASDEAKYLFIINVASGAMSFEEIVIWIKSNISP
jgi:death-on-curing protein